MNSLPGNPDGAKKAPADSEWGSTPTSEINEYLPDARALEERPIPPTARATVYVLVALLSAIVLWSALARVERVVVAPGRLSFNVPKLVIQPLETSVIRSIDVRVGDRVRKGQILAHLDPTFNEASRVASEDHLKMLRAEEARLEAERNQQAFVAEPPSSEINAQLELFQRRQDEFRARITGFDANAAELTAEEKSALDSKKGIETRLRIARQVQEMRATLVQKQAGSRLQMLQAQSDVAGLESEERARQNTIGEIEKKLASNTADRDSYISSWYRDVSDKLSDVHTQRVSLEQQVISAGRRASLSQLVASEDSVVVEIAARSVGSVIKEAEPLISLAPANQPFEASVDIATRDIGWVQIGALARVKFETLPYQQYGTASGTVKVVTHDTVTVGEGNTQKSVYRATIAFKNLSLRRLPPGFSFLPGMQVTAEIRVGTRSILSYVLNPLTKSIDESLREP